MLAEANLKGANLLTARYLREGQVGNAYTDGETTLPF